MNEHQLYQLERIQAVFGGGLTYTGRKVMEEAPFSVTEEFELGDLSEVKEDKVIVPASSNVLFRIGKASANDISNREKTKVVKKNLSLTANIVEGLDLPVIDHSTKEPTGEFEKKYVGKPMFIELTYWVDTELYTSPRYTGKNRAYLMPIKQFLTAMGYDIKTPPKINDELCGSLIGREFHANITVESIRALNQESQQWEDTGEKKNVVKAFKP